MKTRLYRVLVSWDIWLAFIFAVATHFLLPKELPAEIVKDISAVIISILSIIFSIFFAALAVLITAGDNDFVTFLQENGSYTEIIWGYKYSLLIIFISLLISIVLYTTSLIHASWVPLGSYPKYIISFYSMFTYYALFCTFTSAEAAIKYAELRTKFLMKLKILDQNNILPDQSATAQMENRNKTI